LELGYPVTVFDAFKEPGGMVTNCLPDYRIPTEEAKYDIDRVLARGLTLKSDTTVGKDVSLDELRKDYKAIFVAIGSQDPAKLPVPGVEAKGVLYGLPFLRDAKAGKKPDDFGKKVIIIGGGNVGIDCAKTALRLGAEEVNLVCLETRDLESHDRMPAHSWEIEEAEEEGVKMNGSLGPKEIMESGGKVAGLKTTKCISVYDESHNFAPKFADEDGPTFDADTVIIAIGQRSDLTGFEALESERGTFTVDKITLQTSVPEIFAGGDIVRGPASVIEAVADGNEAAISIDRFLKGEDMKEGRGAEVEVAELPERDIETEERNEPAKKDASARAKGFEEIELCFDEDTAVKEALRCLACAGCSECMECVKACEELKAVNHEQEEYLQEIDVGAIVVATGYDLYDPNEKPQFGYDGKNVITGLEFERLVSASGPTGGKIKIYDKEPKKVVFISCVGSRDREGHQYCSRMCCMYTAKHGHLIREKIPDSDVTVYYTDMRAFGKGYEEFYNRIQGEGVKYRYRELDDPIEIVHEGEKAIVKARGHEDIEADLVILAVAAVAKDDAKEMARMVNISVGGDGFFMEAHPKLRPIDTLTDGIFLAGMCQGPKDIPDTVAQASGAAVRTCGILSKPYLEIEATTSFVIEENCRACGMCVEACPYGAIELAEVTKGKETVVVSKVNEALCKGCGICAGTCLNSAIQHRGFLDEQILNMIGALGGGVK
jgi:heterodisulfide reductase subunit A